MQIMLIIPHVHIRLNMFRSTGIILRGFPQVLNKLFVYLVRYNNNLLHFIFTFKTKGQRAPRIKILCVTCVCIAAN
jgi:hypothetical protein